MIWGFGQTGYGAWRVQQMLNATGLASRLRQVSQTLSGAAKANNRQAALEQIGRAYSLGTMPNTNRSAIDRLGPAFFTKVLYFFGRVHNCSTAPLILDSLVVAEIRRRAPKDIEAYVRANGAGWFRDGYIAFIDEIDKWVQARGLTADQIETFLWNSGGRQGS